MAAESFSGLISMGGEPQQLVSEGLISAGHRVECQAHPHQEGAVRLLVLCHGG